jgi:hypothetical protein
LWSVRGSGELGLEERLAKNAPLAIWERSDLLAHELFATAAVRSRDLVHVERREERLKSACISTQPISFTAATPAGIRGERTSSAVAGRPSPSRRRSSIAATLARTSGIDASIRARSPQAAHSTVSQTGLTADPAASRSDAVSWSTFSAAAAANEGLTVAGSAFALASVTIIVPCVFASVVVVDVASLFAPVVVVFESSMADSPTTRNICFFVTRAFGVCPRRIVSASIVASNLA